MIRPVVAVEVLRCGRGGRRSPSIAQDAAGVVGAEPPVLERRVREAEGEDRSDAGLLEPADRLVGVVGRVHDVRPVDERRDARVDALERAPQVAGVHVVGPVVRGELVEDRRRSRRPACSPARDVRIDVSQVWRWVSMKPGMTMSPSASMTVAPSADRGSGRSAAMRSSSMRMSAFGSSPSSSSWVRTMPPLISVRLLTSASSFGPHSRRFGVASSVNGSRRSGSRALPCRGAVAQVSATAEKSRSRPGPRTGAHR